MDITPLRIIIQHNDWTAVSFSTNVKLKHINFSIIKDNNYSDTLLYISGSRQEKLRFVRTLKSVNVDPKLYNINLESNYLEFITPLKDSIYSYLMKFHPYNFTCYVYDGIEDWAVLFNNVHDIIKELISSISNSGKIVKIQELKSNDLFIPMNFLFRQKEKEILDFALNYGFFENPKKINLHAISLKFGVSEVYVSKILRSSLKRLMESVF